MLQRTTYLLKVSIGCIILSSLAFACIPLCSSAESSFGKACSIIIACVFWGGLILGQVFFWRANEGRKSIQQRAFKSRRLKNASIGLVTFGTSKEAKICDITFVISLFASIAFNFFKVRLNWLVIFSLAVLILSFNLHCILNGKTYRYIKVFHLAKKNRAKIGGCYENVQ